MQFLGDFLRLPLPPLLFVCENHAHRHEIQDDQHGRIEADPSEGRQAVIGRQSDTGDTNQQQSEADGQGVALVGPRVMGSG